MEKEAKLKKVVTKRSEVSREISHLGGQVNEINTLILAKRKELAILDKEIAQIKKGFTISEHAILRMLQRAYDLDEAIEKIKKDLTDEIKPKLEALGVVNCKINLKCGLTAVIENNLVVTIK